MGFFGKKKTTDEVDATKFVSRELHEDQIRAKDRKLEEANFAHKQELASTENEHALKLKEKEFDLKHIADERVKKAEDALVGEQKKTAVLEAENKMLVKITDLNADVIDVKKLVSDLIGKLPTVTIGGNLTSAPAKQEKTDKN